MISTTAMSVEKKFDSLSLLALKVKPNVFDLSSGLGHASIRDQIVRAQLLARDLPKVRNGCEPSVLILGAGVAGITAATAGDARGCPVWVVETKDRPFDLQFTVNNRFVGPFMYEWPSAFYNDQSYPPDDTKMWPAAKECTPKWTSTEPISASQLANEITTWLKDFLSRKNNPTVWCSVDKATVENFVKVFVRVSRDNLLAELFGFSPTPLPILDLSSTGAAWNSNADDSLKQFTPDFVVLAAGMGDEQLCLPVNPAEVGRGKSTTGVKGPKFWGPDQLKNLATGQSVGIFGGGDGALQDALRALTIHSHPLETLKYLKNEHDCPAVAALMKEVETKLAPFEEQSRLTYSWTIGHRVFALIDNECKKLALDLAKKPEMLSRLKGCLKMQTGVLRHYVRETHFTKCYLLNRFLVHLIHACNPQKLGGREYELCFEMEPVSSKTKADGKLNVGIGDANKATVVEKFDHEFDYIAVRLGIDASSVQGGQMVSLTPEKKGQRTSLGHVLLPHVLEDEGKPCP